MTHNVTLRESHTVYLGQGDCARPDPILPNNANLSFWCVHYGEVHGKHTLGVAWITLSKG